jgi:hypothetical protein
VEFFDEGDLNRPNPIDVNMRIYKVDVKMND